ncbi:MAG TPA: glycoside hydrolase family 3 N-terminal domain-containing protein [Longimicrobium sp.]|jgi:beta-N-acetylhexosaminidase
MRLFRESGGALLAALVVVSQGCGQAERQGERTGAAARDTRAEAPAKPAVAPLPLDAEGRAWVDARLAEMGLRDKVAQLVFPWISGKSVGEAPAEADRLARWAGVERVGGVIISTGTPAAIAAKLNAAQGRARVPLLVISDLETGPGMRLRPGGTHMPPAMAFGAANDENLARAAGRATALEARAVGIHATLGPILDVQSDPANPIINVRSFGEDPALVARLGSAWARGAQEGGLLAVGKHFPGHGGTRTDSHVGRVIVPADSARLFDVEMVPFRRAVHDGMAGVLVGHIAAVGLEGPRAAPASLSPRMTTGVLRRDLGFSGLVVTDALNMGAVTRDHTPAEASILSLLAGADVLLQPPGPEDVIAAIVRAVESGRIPRARIDDAARRVLAAKAVVGLQRGARVDAGQVAARVGTAAHRDVARQVAERSIVLERDERRLLPLRRGMRVLHVTYTRSGRGPGGATLQSGLVAGGVVAEHVRVSPGTPAATFARLRERARAADLLLVSAEVAPLQYAALGVGGGFAPFVQSAASSGIPTVVVSLGSPYLRSAFPAVGTYVLAWGPTGVSESAAARALTGEEPFRGRLPVTLPGAR